MENSKETVGFKALGEWSVNDLQTLIDSISIIYNIFFVLNLNNKKNDTRFTPFFNQLRQYESKYNEPEYFKVYRRLWFPFFRDDINEETSLYQIFMDLNQYLTKDEELMVYRIRLSSPEGFSFTGIGDIIRQIREFIKDLSYRNKEEKALKKLEVIEKISDLLAKVSEKMKEDIPEEVRRVYEQIVKLLHQEINKLFSLENKGKMADISEFINFLPEL